MDTSLERPHAKQYSRNTRMVARRCSPTSPAGGSSGTRTAPQRDLRARGGT